MNMNLLYRIDRCVALHIICEYDLSAGNKLRQHCLDLIEITARYLHQLWCDDSSPACHIGDGKLLWRHIGRLSDTWYEMLYCGSERIVGSIADKHNAASIVAMQDQRRKT